MGVYQPTHARALPKLSVQQVRSIRDQIEQRVRGLLRELGVPVAA
ncbi:hypothetical protein [Actinocrinis puniceicyclus]|nr:hypothetical protein [Actinocrinis puniceicyclus]